jgi:ATP phosphoribosyltransferase regulatory subunit
MPSSQPNTTIPQGVRVFPPEETARLRRVEHQILSVFERWGFREVITPTFEYLEVFAAEAGGDFAGKLLKFVDRQTGRLLALRADLTPQIARMVATTLRHRPLPLRLAYSGAVFRSEEARAARQREFSQIGVELVGLDLPEADAEMIAMAAEACRDLGLQHYQIDIGQVEYLKGLLDALELPEAPRAALVGAISRKDAMELERLLHAARGRDRVKAAILALPTLYGDPGVFAQAERHACTDRARRALDNLRQVHEFLAKYDLADHVVIDLTEVRAFDYYTGPLFGVFVRGLGFPLGGGGRYDHLIGQFGYPCPATGFALDLEKVVRAVEAAGAARPPSGPDFLLIEFRPDKQRALAVAQALRDRGYRVARDIIKRELAGSLEYAKAHGIRRALILGAPGLEPDELVLREVGAEREERHRVEAFCRAVAAGTLAWRT